MGVSVYKKGQGTAARGIAGVVFAGVGVWAAYAMWATLYDWPMVWRVIFTSAVGLLLGALPLYLILCQRRAVDVLIETQQEMRKVAWSSRREVVGSTIVVIVVVALLSMFILGLDMALLAIYKYVLGLY